MTDDPDEWRDHLESRRKAERDARDFAVAVYSAHEDEHDGPIRYCASEDCRLVFDRYRLTG